MTDPTNPHSTQPDSTPPNASPEAPRASRTYVSPEVLREAAEDAAQGAAPDAAAQANEALAREAADMRDRLLRTLAEMENLRKRTEREVADARAYGIASFARDVLDIADNMHRAPALVIACIEGRVEKASALEQAGVYGSILPAAWSFMLALRSRGLGTAWTTLHIMYEQEVANILGIPATVTQAALFPVAYFTGDDFKPAKRLPTERFLHWDSWGAKS